MSDTSSPAVAKLDLATQREAVEALQAFYAEASRAIEPLRKMPDAKLTSWIRDPSHPNRVVGLREMLVGAVTSCQGGLTAAEALLRIAELQRETISTQRCRIESLESQLDGASGGTESNA
ncbi:MAG: hypothetical protein AAF368_01300 [Planctomycetota bacterium]